MPEVYRAPYKPQYRPHVCDYPPTYLDDNRPIGSIWRCSGCGQYWYKYTMKGIGLFTPARNWEKVRWYNWRHKRHIREMEGR